MDSKLLLFNEAQWPHCDCLAFWPQMRLNDGLDSEEALTFFKEKNKAKGREYEVVDVDDFSAPLNETGKINVITDPNNKVRFVHLPAESINKGTKDRAVNDFGYGKIKGVKSLFPKHWTRADVDLAVKAVFEKNQGKSFNKTALVG